MMISMDKKSLFWIPVYNNSCSSCISHEIPTIWSIIKISSCNTTIDDVDPHTPYFDIFMVVLIHFIWSKEHRHTIYYQIGGR